MFCFTVVLCFINIISGHIIRESKPLCLDTNGTEVLPSLTPYPNYFDWREHDAVTPVKNQLTCEACAAFSVIANIESALKIAHGSLDRMSEQFVIDCVYGDNACNNTASIIETFANIVTKIGGVLREEDYYSYASHQYKCRWNPGPRSPKLVPIVGFKRVYPNENSMEYAVYHHGPLSAGLNSASMARYTGGIDEPSDSDCDPSELNHAVLIVGYSAYVDPKTGKSLPYWIIKNSWGTDWGDKGFYYLVRGRNACGIASDVSYAYVG